MVNRERCWTLVLCGPTTETPSVPVASGALVGALTRFGSQRLPESVVCLPVGSVASRSVPATGRPFSGRTHGPTGTSCPRWSGPTEACGALSATRCYVLRRNVQSEALLLLWVFNSSV